MGIFKKNKDIEGRFCNYISYIHRLHNGKYLWRKETVNQQMQFAVSFVDPVVYGIGFPVLLEGNSKLLSIHEPVWRNFLSSRCKLEEIECSKSI